MNPKDLKELEARIDQIGAALLTCRDEVRAAPAGPRTAHYDAVLEEIGSALPQVLRQYHAGAAELPATEWARAIRNLRGVAVRPARPLDRRVHDLRHDFYEIVHPLEVVGKWPPDPQPGAVSESAEAADLPVYRDLPESFDFDEPPGQLRSTGKWPPDPD